MTTPATEPNVLSIDELVIAVRKLTDTAKHDSACWINADETHCECAIGRIRDALPRCGFVLGIAGGPSYYCVELSHPDRPTTHTMEKL